MERLLVEVKAQGILRAPVNIAGIFLGLTNGIETPLQLIEFIRYGWDRIFLKFLSFLTQQRARSHQKNQ